MTALTPQDFDLLSNLLKTRSGLVLGTEKTYLLESRLTPIARRRGLAGLPELVAQLRMRPSEELLVEITEAMTTNESFFFRDTVPFEVLKTHVLPQLKVARAATRRLRIWCAAASTGQEPYSIAMILNEQAAQWAGWNIEIIGTDLCKAALSKAQAGLYSQFEVQRGLPIQLLMKYFAKVGDQWQVSADIRNMVKYRTFNLLESMAGLGQFDIIFCRNVLIYFDAPTKAQVLDNLRRQMPADGSLFLGAAETVLGLTKALKPVREQRGLYIPVDSPMALAAAG
ncbi:CheR family methyltransferase [Parapedomonas caeni]